LRIFDLNLSESRQMQKEWMHERLESMQPLWPSQIKHTSPKLLEKNWVLAEADGTGKVFVPWVRNSLCSSSSECSQPILSWNCSNSVIKL